MLNYLLEVCCVFVVHNVTEKCVVCAFLDFRFISAEILCVM